MGVASNASREEIRHAYRDLARQHHPDAQGESSAVRMAQINEAWRVLSDPARRAVYDAQLARPTVSARPGHTSAPGATTAVRTAPTARVAPHLLATPSRFPWRFMLVMAAIGIAFVLVNAALTKPSPPEVPDNLIDAGSCVNFADNGDAVEVPCDGTNMGVVVSFLGSDPVCPQDTEEHRDHQGMGPVCVRLTVNGG